jgi:hypothetical protein
MDRGKRENKLAVCRRKEGLGKGDNDFIINESDGKEGFLSLETVIIFLF